MSTIHLEPLLNYAERRAVVTAVLRALTLGELFDDSLPLVVVAAGVVERSGTTSGTRYWIAGRP